MKLRSFTGTGSSTSERKEELQALEMLGIWLIADVDLDIVVVVTAVKRATCNKIRVMNIWPDYGL